MLLLRSHPNQMLRRLEFIEKGTGYLVEDVEIDGMGGRTSANPALAESFQRVPHTKSYFTLSHTEIPKRFNISELLPESHSF